MPRNLEPIVECTDSKRRKAYERATLEANGPKHQLISILNNLIAAGLSERGICSQLSEIIADLENWQNR